MKSRNLELSSGDLERVNEAARKASEKGAKDTLFLLDRMGLIVNVSQKVVLTAIDTQAEADKIFTNIDSTVVLSKGKNTKTGPDPVA